MPDYGSQGTQLAGVASSINVDVPDSVAVNDIIIVYAFIDNVISVNSLAAGFAHAPGSPIANPGIGGAGVHSLSVLWKRATGSDSTGGTYDFGMSGTAYRDAVAVRYPNCKLSGSPFEDTDSNFATAAGTAWPLNIDNTNPLNVASTGADRLGVGAATNWSGGAWTPPTGWSERLDAGNHVHTVVDIEMPTAITVTSSGGSCTGNDKRCGWLGVLLPEPAEVITPPVPPERIHAVQAASRLYVIGARLNTNTIDSANRTYIVEEDDRAYVVPNL